MILDEAWPSGTPVSLLLRFLLASAGLHWKMLKKSKENEDN
jgi:hypothetical protein